MKILALTLSFLLIGLTYAIEGHKHLKTVKTNRLSATAEGSSVPASQCNYLLKKITDEEGNHRYAISLSVDPGLNIYFALNVDAASYPLREGYVTLYEELSETLPYATYYGNTLTFKNYWKENKSEFTETLELVVNENLLTPKKFSGKLVEKKSGILGTKEIVRQTLNCEF